MNSENFLIWILKEFGIKSVLIAAIFALIVWGLAHWTAAPGSEISILWGFVQYTKSGSINDGLHSEQTLDPNSNHQEENKVAPKQLEPMNGKKPKDSISQRTEGNQSPAIISDGDIKVNISGNTKEDEQK